MPRKVETIATDTRNHDPEIVMEDREIQGRKFKVIQFHVITGIAVMARITNIIMPVLGRLAPYLEKDNEGGLRLKSIDPANLAIPLATVFASVGDDKIVDLVCDLLKQTSVFVYAKDGTVTLRKLDSSANINRTFGGDLKLLLAVAAFSLQVNFKDFFKGAAAKATAEDETATTTVEPIRLDEHPDLLARTMAYNLVERGALRLVDLTDDRSNVSIDDVSEYAIWQDAHDAAIKRIHKRQEERIRNDNAEKDAEKRGAAASPSGTTVS